MVKTKQTCKKSTGGTAPRVALKLLRSMPVASAAQEMEVCDQFRHNEFCIVCRDGSVGKECLILCDTCPRVMCSYCISIPSAGAHMIQADNVTFKCIFCHVGAERYGRAGYSPYFGFYKKGKPLFNSFLPIRATLEVSLQSQLSSAPILMLHLVLIDHDTTGGSFKLASDFLRPYFPSGGLEFRTIFFDVGSDAKVEKYQEKADEAIQELMASTWTRVVVAITNHTDNDTGDPFVGYEAKKKVYVGVQVHVVLDILLSPWHPIIHAADESYLWLFSCGALINNITSFRRLQAAVINHRMTATIGFNAVRFQPSFAMHLLLAFAELVVIERLAIDLVFPDMLGQSYKLGCHSDVVFMMPDGRGSLTITKYSWTHSELRPWGQYLPLQCPQCGWTNAWRSVCVAKEYNFECKNDACRKQYTFSQPPHSKGLMLELNLTTLIDTHLLSSMFDYAHKCVM
ncbi:hypothetical protein EDD22DRAFT_854316 [Suillus occidentalis]|nr:hypothetical protein EDD22DRAFT_854316 [Suillus occidentalis]